MHRLESESGVQGAYSARGDNLLGHGDVLDDAADRDSLGGAAGVLEEFLLYHGAHDVSGGVGDGRKASGEEARDEVSKGVASAGLLDGGLDKVLPRGEGGKVGSGPPRLSPLHTRPSRVESSKALGVVNVLGEGNRVVLEFVLAVQLESDLGDLLLVLIQHCFVSLTVNS